MVITFSPNILYIKYCNAAIFPSSGNAHFGITSRVYILATMKGNSIFPTNFTTNLVHGRQAFLCQVRTIQEKKSKIYCEYLLNIIYTKEPKLIRCTAYL